MLKHILNVWKYFRGTMINNFFWCYLYSLRLKTANCETRFPTKPPLNLPTAPWGNCFFSSSWIVFREVSQFCLTADPVQFLIGLVDICRPFDPCQAVISQPIRFNRPLWMDTLRLDCFEIWLVYEGMTYAAQFDHPHFDWMIKIWNYCLVGRTKISEKTRTGWKKLLYF